ncbi:MAG: hypothetical protein LBL66_04185 [Clostridiales bacterium]|nr:hypothetical protein [Clostridiales bacterium]
MVGRDCRVALCAPRNDGPCLWAVRWRIRNRPHKCGRFLGFAQIMTGARF